MTLRGGDILSPFTTNDEFLLVTCAMQPKREMKRGMVEGETGVWARLCQMASFLGPFLPL